MAEKEIASFIREAVVKLGYAILVRNNVGKVKDENGQYHIFGAGKGSADFIGLVTLPNGLARPLAIECKRPGGGRTSPEQKAWLRVFNNRGGAGAICRSVDQALELVQRAREGELFTDIGPFPA